MRVRAAVPDAIAAVIDRCTRPALIFSLAQIDANLAALADAARAARITPLFAAKSFPHPAVRARAAARLAGFDAASAQEIAELPAHGILSVVDPSGRAAAAAAGWPGRLIVGCETVEQVAAAPPHADIAIRVSASLTGRDPAIGAVLDGSGHRRSRFGLDTGDARAQVAELARAAGGRRVGLHVHHGPVSATSGARFADTARAALRLDFDPAFLDLGGAWHAVADLGQAFAEVRAACGDREILVEPGRLLAARAGFACGTVTVARALDDRALRVLDLSRVCHLRWSQPALVAPPPHPGAGRVTLFAGPTCYEDDVLGEHTIDPARYPAGARAVFDNITGYALAWNTGFAGIPPADVVVLEDR